MKVKEITLDCGTFLIYEDYMVGTIFEGADFNEECKYKLWDICKTNFENRSFGYISNRIHSYSVDPTIYLDTSKKFEKLKAIVKKDLEMGKIDSLNKLAKSVRMKVSDVENKPGRHMVTLNQEFNMDERETKPTEE